MFCKHLPMLLWIGGLAACTSSPGGSPDNVAREFWAAAQAGDEARALALSISSENSNFNFEDKDANVQNVRLGRVTVEDGFAHVSTEVTASNGDEPTDISFHTVLAKHEGEWKVDLDETTGQMIQGILGVSMEALGQAMAEHIGEATQDMVDEVETAEVR